MRYWEFALTESQARKDYVTRQYRSALDALASSDQATSIGIGSTEQLIDWFYNLDPSSNKKYFSWIVDRVVSKTAAETLDSIQGVKDLLINFEAALRTQQQAGISVLDSNIGKYRSLAELDAAIQQVSSSKEADDLAEYNQARSESTMLHEDPTWAVSIPQTQEAAMYWTRGTTQCINWGDPEGLHPTRENRFDEYPGTYVIHNRRDPEQIVSIHFESNQIMDWEDEKIPREQWDNTNPFIRKVIDYHGKKLLADSVNVGDLIGFVKFCFNGRWPEAEPKIIEHGNVYALVTYASEIIKGRWPEPDRSLVENMIIKRGNIQLILRYARECIKGRWPEPDRARAENVIIESISFDYGIDHVMFYANRCIKGRWPEAEPKIIEYGNIRKIIDYAKEIIDDELPEFESKIIEHGSFNTIVTYAKEFKKDGWPEAEPKIIELGNIYEIIEYATKFIKGRWPEAESKIIKHGNIYNIIEYAAKCIQGRWPEPDRARVENKIIERGNTQAIYWYAKDCIKGRWPEAESKIIKDTDVYAVIDYAKVFINGRWPNLESKIIEHENTLALVKYAADCIKGRWPEPDRARVENMIIKNGNVREMIIYTASCIRGRWPEAEHVIFSQGTRLDQNQYRNLVQSSQGDGAQ